MDASQKLGDTSLLFLFNVRTRQMLGVFAPDGPAGMELEPNAFGGGSRFPVQVRFQSVHPSGQVLSVPEAALGDVLRYRNASTRFDLLLRGRAVDKIVGIFSQRGQPVGGLSAVDPSAALDPDTAPPQQPPLPPPLPQQQSRQQPPLPPQPPRVLPPLPPEEPSPTPRMETAATRSSPQSTLPPQMPPLPPMPPMERGPGDAADLPPGAEAGSGGALQDAAALAPSAIDVSGEDAPDAAAPLGAMLGSMSLASSAGALQQ